MLIEEKPPLKSLYIFRCLSLCLPMQSVEPSCLKLGDDPNSKTSAANSRRYQEDRQKMIRVSDHFSHRKRSRSKVKTQERKPEQASPGSDPEEGATARPEVTN